MTDNVEQRQQAEADRAREEEQWQLEQRRERYRAERESEERDYPPLRNPKSEPDQIVERNWETRGKKDTEQHYSTYTEQEKQEANARFLAQYDADAEAHLHRQDQREALNREVDRRIEVISPAEKIRLKADMEARYGQPEQELTDKGIHYYARREAHQQAGVAIDRAEQDVAARRGDLSWFYAQEGLYRMRERGDREETKPEVKQEQERERSR